MADRWGRLVSLTGVLFGVLVVVAVFTDSSETPKPSVSAQGVVLHYARHRSDIETGGILFALAFLVLLLFAGALRSYLRRTAAVDGLAALVLAGAVLMAAGTLGATGVEYGIAHNLHDLSPEAVKTANFISDELFLPILGGAFVFAVCSGIAILRGAALPNWLGWVAIVIGIAVLIPPVGFPALLVFVVWSIIVSVLMYLRTGPAETIGTAAVQPS